MTPKIENFSIVDIFIFFKEYIGAGGLVSLVFIALTFLYFKGLANTKTILKEEAEFGFSLEKTKFKISTKIFTGLNSLLDILIGKWVGMVHSNTWSFVLNALDRVIPDSLIEKSFGLNRGFKERIEYMNKEFPIKENNFWHHKERAPDLMDVSPIISGYWFNGEKVEKYLSSIISPRSFYIVIKTGAFVALLTFLVMMIVYRPQSTFGYQPASVERKLLDKYELALKKDPGLIAKYRSDEWNASSAIARKTDIQENSKQYAKEILAGANRYNYHSWGWIFTNGFVTSLFLSLAVGLAFIRKSYFNAFRIAKVPYIRDTHEEYKNEYKRDQIDSYKRNLSSLNIRALGYDRNSPLIKFGRSSGLMEKKGVIGALRKDAEVYQSTLDLSQNTILFGATGTGKSRSTIIPFAQSIFQLKSMNLAMEQAFEDIYNVRTNKLTEQAISEGRNIKYVPLPKNDNVISMAIMDIKSQLWKDLRPYAEKCYLQDTFVIIGAKEQEGQFSIDLLNGVTPQKLVSFIESLQSQMGGKMEKDFWMQSALAWIQAFSQVAYLFSRTVEGEKFMEKRMMKVWSLAFIYELVVLDKEQRLFIEAIQAIHSAVEDTPERISDILTTESIEAITRIFQEWSAMPEETKGGIKANIDAIMAPYSSSSLYPFLSGLGTNTIEVGELWSKIVAFDMNTDDYGIAGKMLLLFVKTLINEEAVKRQMRFSGRTIELTNYFRRKYPELLVLENSPERISMEYLSNKDAMNSSDLSSLAMQDKFIELANEVQAELGQTWEFGSYLPKFRTVLAIGSNPQEITDYQYTPTTIKMAEDAIAIAERIFRKNPRFAEEVGNISNLDPSKFNVEDYDDEKTKSEKIDSLAKYYEYEVVKNRIQREHFFFICDEYQELITNDPSGGCYTDGNFPNISRSTNVKLFIATQGKSAIKAKVGADVMDNFLAQMRSRIYLTNIDKETVEEMVKMAGEGDVFKNPIQGKKLKINDVEQEDLIIYENFNSFLSHKIYDNKQGAVSDIYPYTYDVFAKAEPIDIDFKNFNFENAFSGIFTKQEDFSVPSLKNHFLAVKNIPKFKQTGSSSAELNDNSEQIINAWRDAKKGATDKYNDFLDKGFQPKTNLLTESDIMEMGNLHAFITIQRCGVTIKDHIIISAEEDYIKK